MEKQMSVLTQLSSAIGHRDEIPNIELAKQIAAKNDATAVEELVRNLAHKNKAIQQDCIKVLYETGALNPALVAPFATTFITLLSSKNNRLQWGSMAALQTITLE